MAIIRHGERMDATIGYNKWFELNSGPDKQPTRSFYDPPLTLKGRQNSYKTGLFIGETFQLPIQYIYTSPFTRCIESALQISNAIQQLQDIPCLLRIEYGLAENLGTWHAYQKYYTKDSIIIDDIMSLEFILRRYPNRIDSGYHSVISRESVRNYEEPENAFIRNSLFYKNVIANHAKDQDIIIVTHASAFMSFVIQWIPYSNQFKYTIQDKQLQIIPNKSIKNNKDFLDKRRKIHSTGGKRTNVIALAYEDKENTWTSIFDKPFTLY